VRDRELGLGVVGRPAPNSMLIGRPVFDDELELFAAPDSPYLGQGPVFLADLSGETLIIREPGSATRDLALSCLAARGFTPAKTMEFGSNEAVKRAVAAGLGVGILSMHTLAVDRRAGDIVTLSCVEWDCRREFWLVHREDHLLTPTERAFSELLDSHATS
jgi:DNA-binding transcriptional LysR family regulator